MSSINYHLRELETAQNQDDPRRIMPTFEDRHETILDIGCGIGQTFVASGLAAKNDRRLIGVDIDQEALSYGVKNFDGICFIRSSAAELPLADNSVDMVVSRVSLPYTDIPVVLREIKRVLKPGGTIWLTLHPFSMATRHLGNSLKRFRLKDVIYRSYVIINGIMFHLTGNLFKFPINGRMESVQTSKAITGAIMKAGFVDTKVVHGRHFLVIATNPSADI